MERSCPSPPDGYACQKGYKISGMIYDLENEVGKCLFNLSFCSSSLQSFSRINKISEI